jgi:hypothetical protein
MSSMSVYVSPPSPLSPATEVDAVDDVDVDVDHVEVATALDVVERDEVATALDAIEYDRVATALDAIEYDRVATALDLVDDDVLVSCRPDSTLASASGPRSPVVNPVAPHPSRYAATAPMAMRVRRFIVQVLLRMREATNRGSSPIVHEVGARAERPWAGSSLGRRLRPNPAAGAEANVTGAGV